MSGTPVRGRRTSTAGTDGRRLQRQRMKPSNSFFAQAMTSWFDCPA